jgi:hypothetical protein
MYEIHSRLSLLQTRLELIEQGVHRLLALVESLIQQMRQVAVPAQSQHNNNSNSVYIER